MEKKLLRNIIQKKCLLILQIILCLSNSFFTNLFTTKTRFCLKIISKPGVRETVKQNAGEISGDWRWWSFFNTWKTGIFIIIWVCNQLASLHLNFTFKSDSNEQKSMNSIQVLLMSMSNASASASPYLFIYSYSWFITCKIHCVYVT